MIQTATLSPMLPAQARSTTVPNGPTPGDFAGSFAQANDDAATAPFAADGPPKTPLLNLAAVMLAPGTIARQDAAVTGNTLPMPIETDAAQAIVPEIATLLAEPLAAGQHPNLQAFVAPANSAIPAKTDPAAPNVITKRTVATRPTTVPRLAAFAASSRSGKAKADAPASPSDDLADQPALPSLPPIAQPIVEASPDVVPGTPIASSQPAEGTQTIAIEDAVGTNLVATKPTAADQPDLTIPTTPAPRQSRTAAKLAQAEPVVPTSPSAAQRSALPVATASARRVKMVEPGQIPAPQVTPVALAAAATLPVTSPPVANPPLQIVALAGTVPVAPQISSVSPPLGLASEPGSTAQSSLPAPDADTAPIATPRWVATDATTPVALALAQPTAIQPQPGTVASASQVFGAAIQAATKARDERDTTDPTAPSVAAGAPILAPAIKTAEAQQAPLDMRQERWPHAMIERIEILRDAADATDTRIRLVPDALGAINVSMRKDGDTVHVHFNAEQVATRTLLADAQPRLAELAEARGLKLGQGALGDGNAASSQQRAPTPSQIPNRTTTTAAMIADAADDTRIA